MRLRKALADDGQSVDVVAREGKCLELVAVAFATIPTAVGVGASRITAVDGCAVVLYVQAFARAIPRLPSRVGACAAMESCESLVVRVYITPRIKLLP